MIESPVIAEEWIELIQVALQKSLHAEGLDHFKAGATFDRWSQRFVADVRGYLAAGAPQEIARVTMPDGWWQHLKADLTRLFPRLGLRWRERLLRPEVRMHARVCPHLRAPGDDPARCVVFLHGAPQVRIDELIAENSRLREELRLRHEYSLFRDPPEGLGVRGGGYRG